MPDTQRQRLMEMLRRALTNVDWQHFGQIFLLLAYCLAFWLLVVRLIRWLCA